MRACCVWATSRRRRSAGFSQRTDLQVLAFLHPIFRATFQLMTSMTVAELECTNQSLTAPQSPHGDRGTSHTAPEWLTVLPKGSFRQGVADFSIGLRLQKRILDLCVASGLMIASIPVLAIAAIAIKCSSRGPVFFTQPRVGLNKRRTVENDSQACRRRNSNYGRPFTIYKLRTMHHNIDGPVQTQENDPRIFAIGRLLRKLRIDELPQLLNVLKGEMSMVGPRPECVRSMEGVAVEIPQYAQRLGLKPGLTGIAQIENGYANDLASYERKMAYDQLYLENCCVRNDLRILARTAKVVLTGFGAI